jgi:hypothetical protein
VERLIPPPGPGAVLTTDDADVLGHLAMSFGMTASLMRRPLLLVDLITGDEETEPVGVRLGFDLLWAIGLADRYQVGVALPIVAAQDGDRLQRIGLDEMSLEPVAIGDARLHAKWTIMKPEGGRGLGIGVGAALSLPTGNEEHFAGEASLVASYQLLASYRRRGWVVAGNIGPRLRFEEVSFLAPGSPHGHELVTSLAGVARRVRAALRHPLGR